MAEEDGEMMEEGKIRLKLDSTGEIVSVDEDEVAKANPPQFDLAEDLAQLRHLNEASLLHTLRCRYAASLPHTYAGQSLVVINPVSPLAVYSERVISINLKDKMIFFEFIWFVFADDPTVPRMQIRGHATTHLRRRPIRLPFHVGVAHRPVAHLCRAKRIRQNAQLQKFPPLPLFGCRMSHQNSDGYLSTFSIVFGSPGAILFDIFYDPFRFIAVKKLSSIFLLLEAFGNCRTSLNTNATRFTNIFSLDFDQSGQIASGSVQVLMPERERVTRRPEGEPSFHVFYELVAGATGELRRHLQLDNTSTEPCAFMTPLQTTEDRQKAAVSYARLVAALESLGIAESESRCIWSILAAIYHLGVAGAMRGPTNKVVFARPAAAQRAAALLGCGSLEELAQLAFHAAPVQGMMMNGRSSFRTASPVHGVGDTKSALADKHLDPYEALEGFAQGLYVEAFSALVALINKYVL